MTKKIKSVSKNKLSVSTKKIPINGHTNIT